MLIGAFLAESFLGFLVFLINFFFNNIFSLRDLRGEPNRRISSSRVSLGRQLDVMKYDLRPEEEKSKTLHYRAGRKEPSKIVAERFIRESKISFEVSVVFLVIANVSGFTGPISTGEK
jgi:hypothetical protein